MENFKKNLKKYFFLLAGFYVGDRIIEAILFAVFPNILTYNVSPTLTRTLSNDFLITLLTYLTNIIFIILIYKDLRKINIKSLPVLIVTFFSNIVGVLFYLILLFATDLHKNKIDYERIN